MKKAHMRGLIISIIFLSTTLAMYFFGQAYAKDRFVNDTNKCQLGIMSSCSSLGLKYLNGYGIEKNEQKAFFLFKKACNNNDSYGCTYMEWI